MDILEALRILEVKEGSTQEEVKKQYRRKAKENHPDIKGELGGNRFVLINEAYEVLKMEGTEVRSKLTHKNIFDIERRV